MKNIVSEALSFLARPARRQPGLLMALTLILASIPAVFVAVTGNALKILLAASLCKSFIYAWLLCWIPVVWRRRGVAAGVGAVVAVVMWVLCLPVIFTGRAPSPEVLLLLLETDGREASSFLGTVVKPLPVIQALALAAIYAALVWGGMRFTPALQRTGARCRWVRVAAWCAALLAAVPGMAHIALIYPKLLTDDVQIFEDWTIHQSRLVPTLFNSDEGAMADGFTSLIYTVNGLRVNTSELPRWEAVQRAVLSCGIPASASADSVNIVVIIGESFIKHHSPLYGYPLNTTPRMAAEYRAGRLVPFTDYISPANLTSAAMRNLMNLNSVGDGERWSGAPFFPLVASEAGWTVRLFDNQVTRPRYTVDVQLAAMMRNGLLRRHCYTLSNDTIFQYDGDFLDMVDKIAPPDTAVGRLDIYHLYGQHFNPADRYPSLPRWNHFTSDSLPYRRPWFTPEKKQYIAEYDNATLYNDYVIGRIIDRYRQAPTVFLYFSDHGEEMYDASDCAVRNEPSGDLAGWLQRQFEIPFFVIANDRYIAVRPEVWKRVSAAAARPGMLDNVGQAVLGLAGVTSFYKPQRDIFAPEYKAPARITVTRHIDYDSIMRK